jgi:cystathionine beta-lyase/cystathionine gamma-synthase
VGRQENVMGFATNAIHAAQGPDPATGSVVIPIYQTAAFAHDAVGRDTGWGYARGDNPTRQALERNIALLEGGEHATAFGSGMAAITAVCHLLQPGDQLLATSVLYGGTYRLFTSLVQEHGIQVGFVDSWDIKKLEQALTPRTRMLFIETPTNPLLDVTELTAVAAVARQVGALMVVDNTLATPYYQRPLKAGADIVVHSTTQYLNGHSDGLGGVAVTNDGELDQRLRHYQKTSGGILGPFDAWLVLRGIKTLALRMRQHNANALAVARYLDTHAKVQRVYYPGLSSHRHYALARTQMSGFGGMLSFTLGDRGRTLKFLDGLELAVLAEGLGAVETLICHPATMSHAALPAELRAAQGITDDLVRLSVGCEDSQDQIADLDRALSQL